MFAFINDLCESHLFPSQTSLKKWKSTKIAELAYLYFLGIRILLHKDKTWAEAYCKKAGEPNDFSSWRSSGNDLYVMLHALTADPNDEDSKVTDDIHITPGVIRTWLRHPEESKTHNLFVRLDGMLHISNSTMKSLRRIVGQWDKSDEAEQRATLTKIIQLIHARAPSNSEILPKLKNFLTIDESASMGATGAANVATAVGGLGAGFDPDGEWRSVFPRKKQAKKPVVLHR